MFLKLIVSWTTAVNLLFKSAWLWFRQETLEQLLSDTGKN